MNIFEWLVRSSADPAKLSLTIRGALVALVPIVLSTLSAICGFGIACLGVDETTLNQLVESIIAIVNAVLLVVGAVVAFVGLIRKLAKMPPQ